MNPATVRSHPGPSAATFSSCEVVRKRALAVGEERRRRQLGVQVLDPAPLELVLQLRVRRRAGEERVPRGEDLVDEARLGDLGRADRAAEPVVALQHAHAPAGPREQRRGDERVDPAADRDRVVAAAHRRASARGSPPPAARPPPPAAPRASRETRRRRSVVGDHLDVEPAVVARLVERPEGGPASSLAGQRAVEVRASARDGRRRARRGSGRRAHDRPGRRGATCRGGSRPRRRRSAASARRRIVLDEREHVAPATDGSARARPGPVPRRPPRRSGGSRRRPRRGRHSPPGPVRKNTHEGSSSASRPIDSQIESTRASGSSGPGISGEGRIDPAGRAGRPSPPARSRAASGRRRARPRP